MALVPDYMPAWDYGRNARVIAGANFLLDPIHRGYQIVQTQPNCGTPSAPGPLMGGLTAQLRSQYQGLFGVSLVGGTGATAVFNRDLLNHLGFEIAFDETPNPKASEAVERIGPVQAARCTQQIERAGGNGVLYWASPGVDREDARHSHRRGAEATQPELSPTRARRRGSRRRAAGPARSRS